MELCLGAFDFLLFFLLFVFMLPQMLAKNKGCEELVLLTFRMNYCESLLIR